MANNAKAYFLYGAVVAIVRIIAQSWLSSIASELAKWALKEPIVPVTFCVLVNLGVLGLIIARSMYPRGTQLHKKWLVKTWIIPTLNTGLSAASIMMGLFLGYGATLFVIADRGHTGLGAAYLERSFALFVLIAGIVVFARSNFQEMSTEAEAKRFATFTFVYATVLLGSLWNLSSRPIARFFIVYEASFVVLFALLVLYKSSKLGKTFWVA